MKKPIFSGYGENEDSIKALLDNSFGKILIEEPFFSLLCQRPRREGVDYASIERLFELCKKINEKTEVVFNLDLLAHHQDLKGIEKLVEFLEKVGYDGIRVQDIGLLYLLGNRKLFLELDNLTSHKNEKAIFFFKKHFGNRGLKTMVFAKEMTYEALKRIQENDLELKKEIFVHGPILMFYSKRRLLKEKEFSSDIQVAQDQYEVLLEEKKRYGERFLFKDNEHGSFMFFCQELSLMEELEKLLDLDMDYWFFDFRGKSIDCIYDVSQGYRQLLKSKEETKGLLKEHYPQGSTTGFFNEDTTDKQVSKKSTKSNHKVIGKVVGVIKGKKIAIEVFQTMRKGMPVMIQTPNHKTLNSILKQLNDVKGQEVNQGEKGDIILTFWSKGITTGSLIYQESESEYIGN